MASMEWLGDVGGAELNHNGLAFSDFGMAVLLLVIVHLIENVSHQRLFVKLEVKERANGNHSNHQRIRGELRNMKKMV